MNKFLYLFIVCSFCSCASLFHSTKKTFARGIENQPYDAIIVPGYPYHETDSVWNTMHHIRIEWANYLYKNGYTKNVIFSGAAVYTPYVESKIMKLYASQLDIPEDHIFTEERAEHSVENTYYSYHMAREMGFKKIALATDPFQTNNLRLFIRRHDLNLTLLPIVFSTLARQERYSLKIDPSSAKVDNFVALTDREGLRKRLKGTFGANIIWHAEDLKRKRLRKKYKSRTID